VTSSDTCQSAELSSVSNSIANYNMNILEKANAKTSHIIVNVDNSKNVSNSDGSRDSSTSSDQQSADKIEFDTVSISRESDKCLDTNSSARCHLDEMNKLPKLYANYTAGTNTPTSSVSDARESGDCDTRSFVDDFGDFDIQEDGQFTVVKQKKTERRGRCSI
jgi:hypothetical protein